MTWLERRELSVAVGWKGGKERPGEGPGEEGQRMGDFTNEGASGRASERGNGGGWGLALAPNKNRPDGDLNTHSARESRTQGPINYPR